MQDGLRRWALCPLLAVAVVLGIGAMGPAEAAQKIKITMAASSGNYAYWFAAIEKGYYKDEGLELDIIKAGGGEIWAGLSDSP